MGETIAFGPFSFDAGGDTLLRAGRPVAVGQRGLALLKALAAAGGPVAKLALLEAGWPGTIVEEGNLTVQIAALRKALGPRADGQDWIVTVPRLGYRLLRDEAVTEMPAKSALPQLAVLPFHNLSGDPEQDYFADGVVDDIITALSRFKSFAVIARNSSFLYKGRAVDVRDVARELGVQYVLEGSARRAGNRLRVVAQLVDGTSGAHHWAETYDGALDDVFEVQDRITSSVAALVEPRLRSAEIERARRKPPTSLGAYDLVLRGLPLYYTATPEANAEAVDHFMRAVALEPDYAIALANAAFCLMLRVALGWPSLTADDRALMVDLFVRALANTESDAVIMAQAGLALSQTARQYERGMALLRQAVTLNPNNLQVMSCAGIAYLHFGDLQESLHFSKRGIELSPIDANAHWPLTAVSHAYIALGEYEEALRWAERSHAANSDYDCTYWMLIAANAQLGRMAEAQRWLQVFRAAHPEITVSRIRQSQPDKDPSRVAAILEGLAMAGLPE